MRKRLRFFQKNNDRYEEPNEPTLDDIIAEFAAEELDYEPAAPAQDDVDWNEFYDDGDVKVYGQPEKAPAAEPEDDFEFDVDFSLQSDLAILRGIDFTAEPEEPVYDEPYYDDYAVEQAYAGGYIEAGDEGYEGEYRYAGSLGYDADAPAKSGAVGAMEDEARRLLAEILAENRSSVKTEPDFDLYDFINGISTPADRPEEEPDGEYEEYGEEYEDEYYEPQEEETRLYSVEELTAEFAGAPDAEAEEPDYPEPEEEYFGDADSYEYGVELGIEPELADCEPQDSRSRYAGADNEIEIDSRFNLSGRRKKRGLLYGGTEVDQSADEEYSQVQQSGYSPSQWTPDYDDPVSNTGEEIKPERKKHRYLFGKKKKAASMEEEKPGYDPYGGTAPADGEVLRAFDDSDAELADYAENDEYSEASRYEEEEMYFPPTFREYVLSIFASVFLRMRGSVRGDTVDTMDDSEEDLGPELSPAAASKYYGSYVKSMKLRLRICAVLLLILCYVSLSLPVPGMLKHLPVAAAFCFALQSAIMLLALDVVTAGVLNAFRLKPGVDTLAVLACLVTGIDAAVVALSPSAVLHMPLCAISSCSVAGLLLAAFYHTRAMRKALRVPAIGKRFYAVTGELKSKNRELTLLKSLRSYTGFVRRSEEAGPDETVFVKLSLPLLLLSLLLTVITAAVKKSFGDFIFIFSAYLCASAPFAALLAYSLPFFLGSTRIFKTGSAIAGWSGLCDIGSSRNIIITDRDLFPESAISMESVRIFADEDAQKVISYAGSMMQASGACSAACFMELMEENGCMPKPVTGFEFLPGGGMKGVIEGHKVLCGSTELMRLMNVRIPFRLTDKTTVLLAIDGILYGIFSLYYEPLPQVRRALVALVRSARHPVFAVRDFNINPEMLHNTFDIATDGYDFPPYAERLELSTPGEDAGSRSIAAVICNEGLGPLTTVADVGRRMYVAARANVLVNAISAVLGLFFVLVKFLSAGQLPLGTLFVYMLFAALPVVLISFYVNIKS